MLRVCVCCAFVVQYYQTENAAVAGGRLGITVKDEVYSSRYGVRGMGRGHGMVWNMVWFGLDLM